MVDSYSKPSTSTTVDLIRGSTYDTCTTSPARTRRAARIPIRTGQCSREILTTAVVHPNNSAKESETFANSKHLRRSINFRSIFPQIPAGILCTSRPCHRASLPWRNTRTNGCLISLSKPQSPAGFNKIQTPSRNTFNKKQLETTKTQQDSISLAIRFGTRRWVPCLV